MCDEQHRTQLQGERGISFVFSFMAGCFSTRLGVAVQGKPPGRLADLIELSFACFFLPVTEPWMCMRSSDLLLYLWSHTGKEGWGAEMSASCYLLAAPLPIFFFHVCEQESIKQLLYANE